MAITLDKETARDLIQSKLAGIEAEIDKILSTWHISTPAEFIKLAKSGELGEGSIRDGIAMRQLVADQEKYETLLQEAAL